MFKKSLLTLIAVFLAIGGRAELSKDTKGNYLIGSAQELSEFTLLVRSGQRAANALLTADIDMSGVTNSSRTRKTTTSRLTTEHLTAAGTR